MVCGTAVGASSGGEHAGSQAGDPWSRNADYLAKEQFRRAAAPPRRRAASRD
ncbi:MAG TPA: hypothetical protein VF070_49245 [Streptosporangiaceae bacterium]